MTEGGAGAPAPAGTHATPTIARRLACFVYEGVLLFGVVMLAGLLFAGLFQQRHALQGQNGLRALLFVVLCAYFVWFWTHGGQTLAMKTWHIRLMSDSGGRVSPLRALARYLLAWLWFLPALLGAAWAGVPGGWAMTAALAGGVAAYAALSRLHPSRQFWHDVVCGTMLVDTRAPSTPSL